ncbi:hypothetical protein BGZ94_006820, partial [Podila epigama]
FTVFTFIFALILTFASQAYGVCWCSDKANSARCAALHCDKIWANWQCINGDAERFGRCCKYPPRGM